MLFTESQFGLEGTLKSISFHPPALGKFSCCFQAETIPGCHSKAVPTGMPLPTALPARTQHYSPKIADQRHHRPQLVVVWGAKSGSGVTHPLLCQV